MRYIILLITTFLLSYTPADAQFGKLINKAKSVLSDEGDLDIAGGLKEALEIGVDDAVESLAQENGYFDSPYKILIPDEAAKIVSTVSKLPGLTHVEKDLVAKMNEAAELAAKKAGPIFFEAISKMSFADATNILMGEQDAATRYLESTSGEKLYEEFMPVIQSALDEVDARSIWKKAVDAYNKIPFQRKLNPDLDDHVNRTALNGMFSLVEKKEQGIREDVCLRTSPLLKDVFAKQDN
jgi:hypothetical protein